MERPPASPRSLSLAVGLLVLASGCGGPATVGGQSGDPGALVNLDVCPRGEAATPLATPERSFSFLGAITFIGPGLGWAAGSCFDGVRQRPLAASWDGVRWRMMEVPFQPDRNGQWVALHAAAADDVWAVENWDSFSRQGSSLARWDGVRWSTIQELPRVRGGAIDGSAANDLWLVGTGVASGCEEGDCVVEERRVGLAFRWDGAGWAQQPTPTVGRENNYLTALDVRAADDVWAGGYYLENEGAIPLLLHWDGRRWSVMRDLPRGLGGSVNDIAALAPDDVWLAGGFVGPNASNFLHWDGRRWEQIPSPHAGVTGSAAALAFEDPQRGWAVGDWFDAEQNWHPLVLTWDGRRWRDVGSGIDEVDTARLGALAIGDEGVWAAGYRGRPPDSEPTLLRLDSAAD